jgi:glutathione reductase (NADPH)
MMSSASASASPAAAVNKYDYDLICIGGGSGGIACAKRASSLHSRRVLCVERQIGKLGGTCVNVGCVPKKVMWTAACIAHTLRHDAAHYGFDVNVDVGGGGGGGGGGPKFDYAKLKKARDGYVSRLNGIYASGFASAGVACVYGDCSLSLAASAAPGGGGGGGGGGGRAAVVLVRDTATGATARYTAENIVIATGGRPRVPCEDGDGVAEHCITSDGFFDLSELPDVSVVVGAGYVAVELAGVLASLGSEVHLVLRRGKALRDFDPMVSDGLDDEMRRGGIFVHRHTGGVRDVRLDPKSGKKNVTLVSGDAIYGADAVIMAAGRMPNTENLVASDAMDAKNANGDGDVDEDGVSWSGNTEGMGLEKMGVKLSKNGYVVVDEYQNTSVDGVYAIG